MDLRTMLPAVIFGLLSYGTSAQSSYIPCTNIFRYEYSGSNYFGVITLQNNTCGQIVKIEMEQSEVLNSDYKAKISLLNIDQKRVWEPITYRVDFPLQNVMPRVIRITVNDVIICGFQSDSSSRAIFSLTQTLSSFNNSSSIAPCIPQTPSTRKIRSFAPSGSRNSACGREFGGLSTNSITDNEGMDESQFPWIVAILLWNSGTNKWRYKCGGSLISAKAVVTAANCLYDSQSHLIAISQFLLSIGRKHLDQWTNGVNVHLKRIIIHPDYRRDRYDADIAILQLKESVSFTTSIYPVCLWQGSSSRTEGHMGSVIGWGYDETSTGHSNEPKQIEVKVVFCRRTNYRVNFTDRTLCGERLDETVPCFGDSGSGFMQFIGQKWILRGVVNSGFVFYNGKCKPRGYALFSDAPKFTDWIKSNLN